MPHTIEHDGHTLQYNSDWSETITITKLGLNVEEAEWSVEVPAELIVEAAKVWARQIIGNVIDLLMGGL